MNPNHTTINAAAQVKNPASVLNHFRRAVTLRKAHPALVYGKYTLLDKKNPAVYAYTRTGEGETLMVVLNFSARKATASVPVAMQSAERLLSNYDNTPPATKKTILLQPYEAAVYKLRQ